MPVYILKGILPDNDSREDEDTLIIELEIKNDIKLTISGLKLIASQ